MHLILTGATGVVGSAVLNHILTHGAANHITKLTILSRNPSIPLLNTQTSPPTFKVDVIPHKDFLTYPPALLSSLADAEALIWALGISQNLVSASEYVTITRDYTVAAAKAFGSNAARKAAHGDKPFKFIYVSGEYATTTPGRFTPTFGRVKGETEKALLDLNASAEYPDLRVYSARPGGVDLGADPAVDKATKAKRNAGLKKFEPVLMPLFRVLYANMVSPTKELGKVLTDLAVGDGERIKDGPGISGEGRTIGNVALRKMGGL
jgi:hypothetical protein